MRGFFWGAEPARLNSLLYHADGLGIGCCRNLRVPVETASAGSERLGRSCHLRGWPGAQNKAHSELDLKHRTWFLGLQVGS